MSTCGLFRMATEGRTAGRGGDDAPSALDRLARHRTGHAAMSFAESTVVPVPLETVVAPLMVGHPRRALGIAAAIWIGCILGALVFYGVGALAADPLVRPALGALGLGDEFERIIRDMDAEGLFWTVFLVSASPAPMQVATLGAGAAGGSIWVFLAGIGLSRGLRYFGLALLAQVIWPRIAALGMPRRVLLPGLILGLLALWGVAQLV